MSTDHHRLVDFLLARLAEDESTARAAIDDDGGETGGFEDAYEDLIRPPSGVGIAQGGFGEAAARMIATYAVPSRVLREVEAHRRVVTASAWILETYRGGTLCDFAYEALFALASVYNAHPDYREEWT
jgi:hypothetical protein